MSITQRNNIPISGSRKRTMVLAYGFDCDQSRYPHRMTPGSTLHLIDNVGHCPHRGSPATSAAVMSALLRPISP